MPLSATAWPVASLRLVSPGAANDGVTLYFLEKKTDDAFLLIALWKVMTFLAVVSLPLPYPRDLRRFFPNSATQN